ncbi:alpha/beta fold hydrolase [Pseudonocardia sp. GCM10023141]|uniref:alpha/beta fold hydrolase n=1 Tax=Pseudonocardia sp. GCM10023141 TaxID=3252653 RepID=UPI00361995B6
MTVVLLHPIALDGACWRFLGADMPPGSVHPDLLGHGDRPDPGDGLTLDTFARDVLDTVSGELDLVGLSLGGAVALRMALLRPDRVRSALLACSGTGGVAVREVLRARADDVERSGVAATVEESLRRWFTPEALGASGHPGPSYARERLLAGRAGAVAASWRALAELDAWDDLPSVAVPTTVLHATQDPTGSPKGRRAMAERIPGARFATVEGPHMAPLERPAEFAAAVREHLDWAGRW